MAEQKIKLVILTLSAGGIGGGLERMETLLFRRLDRDIFEPVIVVMNDPVPGEIAYDESIPYEFTGTANRFGSLLKLIRDADIVTFNGGFDPLVCEATAASGVPSLVEVMHNTDAGQAYDAIDLTICVSETARAEQPFADRAIVIPNGVEIDKLPFDPAPLPREKIVILESARRDKPVRYHLDELAEELLVIDPRIELWLAGRGQTGEAGKTGDRIRYFGLVREVEQLYGAADMLLALSEKEALGLSAIEAMACGCVPVVAGDTGLREVVSDGVNGFVVDASDKEQVTRTIRKAVAMRDGEEWGRMRAAARAAVEQKFDIVRCAAEYGDALRKLVSKKGRRARTGPTGPERANAPADALLADLYFLLSTGKTQLALDRVQDVFQAQIPIRHPKAVRLAGVLAGFFEDRGAPQAADALCEALYNSGVRDEEALVRWVGVRQGDTGFILDELEALDLKTREAVMRITERKLDQGRVGEAFRLLERYVKRSPDDAQSRKLLEALRSKL